MIIGPRQAAMRPNVTQLATPVNAMPKDLERGYDNLQANERGSFDLSIHAVRDCLADRLYTAERGTITDIG